MPGGGAKPQEQSTQSEPWGPAQKYLDRGLKRAEALYKGPTGREYYPGQTYVGPSDVTQEAQRAILERARNPAAYEQAFQGNLTDTLSGKYLSPESNPWLKGTFDKASNDVQARLGSTFNAAGGFGGGLHQQGMQEGLQGLATDIYGGNYQAERDRMMQAGGQVPAAAGLDWQRLAAMQGVGAQQEAYAMQPIQEAINRYNFAQQAPWQRLQQYQGMILPTAGMGGSQTMQQGGGGGSPWAGAAGGAMGGAATGAMIGGPWGAAIGGIAGGTMGYLGSR